MAPELKTGEQQRPKMIPPMDPFFFYFFYVETLIVLSGGAAYESAPKHGRPPAARSPS